MKIIVLFIAIIFCNYSIALSQNVNVEIDSTFKITLSKSLKNLSCHLHASVSTDSSFEGTIYDLSLVSSKDKSLIISFHDTVSFSPELPEFIDLNMDGYLDIRITREIGRSVNAFWKNAWIFNPIKKTFVFSASFSELPDEIEINKNNRTITYEYLTFYGAGSAGNQRVFGKRKFRVICNELREYYNTMNDEISKLPDSFYELEKGTYKRSYYYYKKENNKPLLCKIKDVICITENNKSEIETTIQVLTGTGFKVISKRLKKIK